jgi:hypothetical protein
VRARLRNTPANEFEENPELLAGAFPDVYILGARSAGLEQSPGSVDVKRSTRLLRYFDQRAAKNPLLIFFLFNQLQRHAACAKVKSSARSHRAQEFVELVNEDGFEDRLRRAVDAQEQGAEADPAAAREADQLLKQLLPLVQTTASKVPFGPFERKGALTHLYAMAQFHDLPIVFWTFSPAAFDSPLAVRLAASHAQDREWHGDGDGGAQPWRGCPVCQGRVQQ